MESKWLVGIGILSLIISAILTGFVAKESDLSDGLAKANLSFSIISIVGSIILISIGWMYISTESRLTLANWKLFFTALIMLISTVLLDLFIAINLNIKEGLGAGAFSLSIILTIISAILTYSGFKGADFLNIPKATIMSSSIMNSVSSALGSLI